MNISLRIILEILINLKIFFYHEAGIELNRNTTQHFFTVKAKRQCMKFGVGSKNT
jgi:hypothetical protein